MDITLTEAVNDIYNVLDAAKKLAGQARNNAVMYCRSEEQIRTQAFRDMVLREGIQPAIIN